MPIPKKIVLVPVDQQEARKNLPSSHHYIIGFYRKKGPTDAAILL